MTLSEELQWRGFVSQTTYKDISVLDGQPIAFYWGVDPSASSMTIGNLAAAMMVKQFIKHGHKAVLLVGGATGLIGDPDGKAEERSLKTPEDIKANTLAIAAQYRRLFAGLEFTQVDNYDWFQSMGYLDFLREVGKHVSMRQMLQREFVQSRLNADGAGISYAEFSYVLIQAFDFLQLYRDRDVTLQVCGSDQWGNSIAGVDLIRRITGAETNVWSTPLVINKATGKKFGKTEGGAIWLDAAKTSPTQFYQFWINADDDGVKDYLKIFTELSQAEVTSIMKVQNQDKTVRHAQISLARAVTSLVHGKQQMELAEVVTQYLTGRRPVADADDLALQALRQEIPAVSSLATGSVLQALVDGGLTDSISEARRLLLGNAVAIDGQKISREHFKSADFHNGLLMIKKGKKYSDSVLVELLKGDI